MRKRQCALLGLIGALALSTLGFGAQDPIPVTEPVGGDTHAEALRFWNELQASVKDGTLTAAQAKQRLDEYRASRGLPPATNKKQRRAQRQGQADPRGQAGQQTSGKQPGQVKASLDTAVRKGRMSQEEADKRWEKWQRNNPGAGAPDAQAERTPPAAPKNAARSKRARAEAENTPQMAKLREKLKAAVQRGDMTQDQAMKRLNAGLRNQKQAQGSDQQLQQLQQLMQRVQAAMAQGSLTSAEALRFLEPLKLHLDGLQAADGELAQTGDSKPRAGKAKAARSDIPARIQAMVDAGTISPLQGKARLEAYRRTQEKGQEQAAPPSNSETADRKTAEVTELERQIDEVNTAVHENRLSREDAFAQIQELRKNAAMARVEAEQAARAERELESFQRRLGASVRAGKLTAEQAVKRLEAYRKRTER